MNGTNDTLTQKTRRQVQFRYNRSSRNDDGTLQNGNRCKPGKSNNNKVKNKHRARETERDRETER